jgi:UDP-N-acetyl-2-amino-2-deoxyglucuronate dehydrogenase
MKNFALTGVAGFVAPRHLKAIHETGNQLVAALDPHDSVGILDSWFPDAAFFQDHERFDRFLDKRSRGAADERIDFISVCSPNHLHDAHIRVAFRNGADVICEKPLVLNPWNLDAIEELEHESGHRAWTVLQLRTHPALKALHQTLANNPPAGRHQVELTYIAPRGNWYHNSWKGQVEKSGGIGTNIGIHFFDLLHWLFGEREHLELHASSRTTCAGRLRLERGDVSWFLSTDIAHSPVPDSTSAYRSICIDGQEVEFTDGFADLHTEVYRLSLAGKGFGIKDARPALETAHQIRIASPTGVASDSHPYLKK